MAFRDFWRANTKDGFIMAGSFGCIQRSRLVLALCSATALILAAPGLANAQLKPNSYKWVGSDGKVHYGDYIPAAAAKDESEALFNGGKKIVSPRQQTAEEIEAAQKSKDAKIAEQEAAAERRVASDKLYLTFPRFEQLQAYERDQADRQRAAIEALTGQLNAAKTPAERQPIQAQINFAALGLDKMRSIQVDERQMWLEAQSRAREGQLPGGDTPDALPVSGKNKGGKTPQ